MPLFIYGFSQLFMRKGFLLSSDPHDLFSLWFGKNTLQWHNPSADGKKFHTLYEASLTLGSYIYRVLFMLVLYACVITLIMHIAKYVLSLNPRATAEARTRITRVFIVALFCGTLVGIIAIIVKAVAV